MDRPRWNLAPGFQTNRPQFPERWFPRRFDLFGASHQVMHVMVLCAALAYTMAVLAAFDYKHGKGALCKT